MQTFSMQPADILQHFNLLFVDDDIQITADAYALFSPQFKSVALAHNTERALELLKQGNIDLFITDIEMPEEDGLTLVEKVRQVDTEIPIIILSAYSEQNYLLRAANLRIDGYIIKPLTSKKLAPVFEKLALRLQHRLVKLSLCSNASYDFLNGMLLVDEDHVSLGKKERDLLELFITKPGRVISRLDIQKAIWPDGDMTESAFKNLLREVRRKLKYDLIQNIPAQGWIINRRSE